MVFKTKNDLGMIIITDTAIETIAAHVACTCYGVVSLANRKTKQGILNFSMKDKSISSAIKVTYQHGIIIDIHIFIEFGMNIKTISNNIIGTLSYILNDSFGLKVNKINVYVDGFRAD